MLERKHDRVVDALVVLAVTVRHEYRIVRQLVATEPVVIGVAADRHEGAVRQPSDFEVVVVFLVLHPFAVDEDGKFDANRRVLDRIGLGWSKASAGERRVVLETGTEVLALDVARIPLAPDRNTAGQKPECGFGVGFILPRSTAEHHCSKGHFIGLHEKLRIHRRPPVVCRG